MTVATYVKEDNIVLELYIDYTDISGHRKSSFAIQLSSQGMIVKRITKFTLYNRSSLCLKYFNQLLVRSNSLLKVFFKTFYHAWSVSYLQIFHEVIDSFKGTR